MLKLLKISNSSLLPDYQEGDFVLVAGIPSVLRSVKPGDVVAFRKPPYGMMIKKIDHIVPESGEAFVVGTHRESVDSRHFGPVPRSDFVGKVIWHVKRRRL
jgi:signal peptidase I